MPTPRYLSLLPLALLAACGASKDAPATTSTGDIGGTVVISAPSEPDNLLPPITQSLLGKQVEDLVFQHLADVGAGQNTVGDEGFTRSLATGWSWAPDSLSIIFALNPAARWHDGRKVTAADVAFSHALYVDPKTASPAAAQLANIDSITARDSVTAVAWFAKRTPSQFFDVSLISVLPKHLLEGLDRSKLASAPIASQPVGSGPFRFVRWVPNQLLELAADTTGTRRAKLDRVVVTVAPDAGTAYTRVATGEADIFEAVRPDKVSEVAANPALKLLVLPSLDYSYLGFNLVDASTGAPHKVLGDRVVRRALTMATDRRSIVANLYDTLATVARGPFTGAQANADTTLPLIPYSLDSANALLDAAGWKRGADSVRVRNGVRLAFSISVPSTSTARMRAAVLFQEQFRRAGVDVTVNQADMSAFVATMMSRKFDAVLNAWHSDPGPGSVRDTWTSSGAAKGGNNFGAYRSAAFDAQVDSGEAARTPEAMRRHFSAAWRVIADDAPAIWLADIKQSLVVNSRIEMTGMRPDAWWAGMANWSIPAAKRIARDGTPAATAAR